MPSTRIAMKNGIAGTIVTVTPHGMPQIWCRRLQGLGQSTEGRLGLFQRSRLPDRGATAIPILVRGGRCTDLGGALLQHLYSLVNGGMMDGTIGNGQDVV
eukprot:scaffold2667_cov237-Amphora_coffeaeformis.AAC.5